MAFVCSLISNCSSELHFALQMSTLGGDNIHSQLATLLGGGRDITWYPNHFCLVHEEFYGVHCTWFILWSSDDVWLLLILEKQVFPECTLWWNLSKQKTRDLFNCSLGNFPLKWPKEWWNFSCIPSICFSCLNDHHPHNVSSYTGSSGQAWSVAESVQSHLL